jgi:hypothetical protein
VSDQKHRRHQLATSESGIVFDPASEATAMASAAGRALLRWRGGWFVWGLARARSRVPIVVCCRSREGQLVRGPV